ncbi:Hypothetical predicted protein [Pelobates cultripes]|uniref:CYRIA/CYRIB Rac1 binding domain-containing protein n=1 Tax=Pelobates cultripes TaxID=61616 RepID=A0AAD1VNQ2_PELCU|nr:Hypothetical predicted protein [Pelobates cultripes]
MPSQHKGTKAEIPYAHNAPNLSTSLADLQRETHSGRSNHPQITSSGNNCGTSIPEICSNVERHQNFPAATTATQNGDRKKQGGIPCTKPRRTSSPTTTAHHWGRAHSDCSTLDNPGRARAGYIQTFMLEIRKWLESDNAVIKEEVQLAPKIIENSVQSGQDVIFILRVAGDPLSVRHFGSLCADEVTPGTAAAGDRAVTGLRVMGNLIKVLGKDLENCPHFFLDFENAQPTEAETAVWNQVNSVLEEAQGVLAELQSYRGAGQEIRQAIQNPLDLHLQEEAWRSVCPLVAKLKRFYEFSLRLENALHSLLEALTSPPYAPTQHLEREQALAKQFAEILHFTLSFDELKNKSLPIEDTTDCLSTMACVCRVMLETPGYRSRFTSTETLLFCMRVMVGVIILYDHVHPVGAFAKTSKIDMKGCIKVLKDQPSTSTEGLLNALRYTTRHLHDDTTSKQIRALLQ